MISTSTWTAEPLDVLSDDEKAPPPSILARTDGVELIYPGRLNVLFGQAESGKTWLALLACLQEIRKGNNVIFYDFEDYRGTARERMESLGATEEELKQFYYARVDEPLDAGAWNIEVEPQILSVAPTLIVIDSMDELLAMHGKDPDKSQQVREVRHATIDKMTSLGPAVIIIDHVGHKDKSRQTGSQAKVSQLGGASINVEIKDKFGRGTKEGMANLRVEKDRPGHVRAEAFEAQLVGNAHFVPGADGSLKVYIDTGTYGGHYDRSGLIKSKLLPWLRIHGETPSRNKWLDDLVDAGRGMKKEYFLEAVDQGIKEGYWHEQPDGSIALSEPTEEAEPEVAVDPEAL